jgi:LPS sulfotransferase NodH
VTQDAEGSPVRFIILCGPRTGSTLLTTALNSHPAVVCFNEVFNFTLPNIDYAVGGYDGWDAGAITLRSQDPAAFMERHLFGGLPANVCACGFKFMYDHFWEFEGLIEALQAMRGLRIVHLTRHNQVRAFLSYKLAGASGAWRQHRPRPLPTRIAATVAHPDRILPAIRKRFGSSPSSRAIVLPPEECTEYIETRVEQEAHFSHLFQGHPSLDLRYEALLADRAQTFARVLEFLDVPPHDLRESVERQNPGTMRDLIANYDELKEALSGTPYAWMMDEGQ